MKKVIKINIDTLIGIFIYMMVFFNTSLFNYNILKYCCIVIIGLFLITKKNIYMSKKYSKFNWSIVLFLSISMVISLFSKGLMYRNSFFACLVFTIIFIELVFYLEMMAEKKRMDLCLNNWYKCTIVITIITDILVYTIGEVNGVYLVGTKFAVVYQHLFLLTLFLIVNTDTLNKKYMLSNYVTKIKFLIILFLTIIISLYVDCATGLIGTILLFCFCIVLNKTKNILSNPLFFIFFMLLAYGTMWLMNVMLLNKGVAQFITVFLDRDLTLTGRTIIFSGIPQVMRNKWLIGFGYGSSYEICMRYLGYADTQNALMEWIVQIGIIGTSTLLLIFYLCVRKYHKFVTVIKEKKFDSSLWILALIYVYIILGVVEITYTMQFIALMLILYSMSVENINKLIKK